MSCMHRVGGAGAPQCHACTAWVELVHLNVMHAPRGWSWCTSMSCMHRVGEAGAAHCMHRVGGAGAPQCHACTAWVEPVHLNVMHAPRGWSWCTSMSCMHRVGGAGAPQCHACTAWVKLAQLTACTAWVELGHLNVMHAPRGWSRCTSMSCMHRVGGAGAPQCHACTAWVELVHLNVMHAPRG